MGSLLFIFESKPVVNICFECPYLYTHLLEGGLVAVGSCDEVRLMRGNDLTLVHGGLHRDDGCIVRSEGGSNGQTEPRIVYEIYKHNNTVPTTSISLQGCC